MGGGMGHSISHQVVLLSLTSPSSISYRPRIGMAPLHTVSQTPPIEEFYRRTIAGQELRRAKLPSTEALKGLAAVYHKFAEDKPDRLLIASIAILVVTGFRIGE